MIIKKYIVNNMNEAMTKIRREMGKDAVIISQRKVHKKGIFGFLSSKQIEVTAASESINKVSRKRTVFDNEDEDSSPNITQSIEAIKKAIKKNSSEKENRGNNLNSKIQGSTSNELINEMREMKSMINSIKEGKPQNEKNELFKTLESYDLDETIIEDVIHMVKLDKSDLSEEEKVKNVLEKVIKTVQFKTDHVVVFVGPTGVGKTTTIAKLAGKLSLVENKKVGLITVDTYRIGAVEQLKTYADIMNLPFEVVFSIKDMEKAIDSMKDRDVILVDTTGRSSKNAMQISELRAFIEKTHSTNINLVMSCTTKNRDIKSIVEGYSILNYNSVIITKLDETTTYGSILNILNYAKKPVCYVTTGQNVPDDIKVLGSKEISNLIMGVETVC
ncbi:MAG: flagellar biosynthesis protein FlhF [Clostridium sp.]|nr:flagellar biosynthesis protein FlhF [Clostridium sp.]